MLQTIQGPFLEATTIVVISKKWRTATNEFQSRGKVYLFGEIVFTGEIVILAISSLFLGNLLLVYLQGLVCTEKKFC